MTLGSPISAVRGSLSGDPKPAAGLQATFSTRQTHLGNRRLYCGVALEQRVTHVGDASAHPLPRHTAMRMPLRAWPQLLLGRAVRHMSPSRAISAVHGQERAGNVLSARGTEVQDSFSDLIGLTTPSPGNRLEKRGVKLLVHP